MRVQNSTYRSNPNFKMRFFTKPEALKGAPSDFVKKQIQHLDEQVKQTIKAKEKHPYEFDVIEAYQANFDTKANKLYIDIKPVNNEDNIYTACIEMWHDKSKIAANIKKEAELIYKKFNTYFNNKLNKDNPTMPLYY